MPSGRRKPSDQILQGSDLACCTCRTVNQGCPSFGRWRRGLLRTRLGRSGKANGGGPVCLYDRDPEDLLPRIAGLIQREFDKLPVAPGKVTAQPSPHTLRGAETNFYADATEQQFDTTILAQKIHIIAKPVQYRWDYGDGTSLGPTTTTGGPLPQDRWGEKTGTSHAYAQTGDFNVVLTTYFQGTYSVNGGPALPIPNQGQFSTAPQTVSVWRSVTRNYADDCITNPRGQGCPGATVTKDR